MTYGAFGQVGATAAGALSGAIGGAAGAAAPSQFQNAYNQYSSYYAPTMQGYQGNIQNGYNQIGYQNALSGLDQQGLMQGYQQNIGDNQTQIDVNNLQQGRSLADAAAYASMIGHNNAAEAAQQAGLKNTFQNNLFNINSQATANGSYTSQGVGQQRTANFGDYLSQSGNAKEQALQQNDLLGMRGGNAQVQAQVLARESQNLGMKPAQLQTTLQTGLAKLGLQNQMSVGNLLDAINGGNMQALQLYQQIITQAGQYATSVGQTP